jgi:predicted anti-sigma-YlaC factor YlaD
MNCVRCEELMSDYLEGALSQADRTGMDIHMSTCARCGELLASMSSVLDWGKTFPVYEVPRSLPMQILASTPVISCARCEERMSDYLENALSPVDNGVITLHLESCTTCSKLIANMAGVLEWGKTFPVHEAPAWLPTRIIANTPRVARESWIDTIAAAWKWVIDPRRAMGAFTAVLVLGWMGNLAGISPKWSTVVRNPSAIYYEAQGAVNRAYDEAVRKYYRSPFVTEIKTRIEQLREIS